MRICNSLLLSILVAARCFALPLTFEQRDSSYFLTRFAHGTVEIQSDCIVLRDVTLRFEGASSAARLEGLGPAVPSTYLRAGFSRTFPQFPKLAIHNLYPGVDAVFYGAGDNLEYDLTIAPGASPARIRILITGAQDASIDTDGNLSIQTPSGELRQLRPHVFQRNREVSARYVLLARNEVGIRLGKHDRRSPLTIDPVLASMKSFGGSGLSSASAIATDSEGNLYVAGSSDSVNFPTTSHAFDPHITPPLFVLSNAGKTVESLTVATETIVGVVGGTNDGKILYANTPDGIYVSGDSGHTWRQDPPLTAASNAPSLVGQTLTVNSITLDPLDPATILVATNFGLFTSDTGGESGGFNNTGLATSASGFVSVYAAFFSPTTPLTAYAVTTNPSFLYKTTDVGATWQQLNPTYPGEPAPPTDPFPQLVATLSSDGSTLYVVDGNGTLLKSTDGGETWTKLATGFFNPVRIQVDPNNSTILYVVDYSGLHSSTDGGLTFSTFSVQPPVLGLAVDSSSAVYLANFNGVYVSTDHGKTLTPVSQLTGSGTNNLSALAGKVYAGTTSSAVPFVVKLDPSGSNILYATFFGGSVFDTINGIAVDSQGNAVVVGTTSSPDFPLTIPTATPPTPNNFDAFVAKLNSNGTNLIYSTAYGGAQRVTIQAVALDSSGAPYVTGNAISGNFPTTANVVQPAIPSKPCPRTPTSLFLPPNIGSNAFVAKLSGDGTKLDYSTFLTGSCGSLSAGIAVDSAGDAVVVGYTTSTDFPVSSGSYQSAFPGNPNQPYPSGVYAAGFVTKLNPTGTKILASSYLGGGYMTQANAVTLDASANAYITGFTQGFAPGATPGAYQTKIVDRCTPFFSIGPSPPYTGTGDAFVLKLDATFSSAQFLTYLGGSCGDSGSSLALDASGDIWVSGTTASPDFPLKEPFQVGSGNFVAEFNPDASQLLFSSASIGSSLVIGAPDVFLAGANGFQAAVEKVDPTTTPTVEIDSITPVIAYPPPSINPGAVMVAPGLLVQINGSNLGPATKLNGQVDATGRLPFILGGTMVFFDDFPAPLMSIDASTIICFAPFEVTTTTHVTVVANGQNSNPVAIGVTPSAPQILSIINQDGTLNSAQHPAKLDSVITLYVSGLGETNPPSDDGLTNAPPLPVPLIQVTVFLQSAVGVVVPQFVGAAPGLIAGITQVNLQVPENTIILTGGTASIGVNSANATLYVTK